MKYNTPTFKINRKCLLLWTSAGNIIGLLLALFTHFYAMNFNYVTSFMVRLNISGNNAIGDITKYEETFNERISSPETGSLFLNHLFEKIGSNIFSEPEKSRLIRIQSSIEDEKARPIFLDKTNNPFYFKFNLSLPKRTSIADLTTIIVESTNSAIQKSNYNVDLYRKSTLKHQIEQISELIESGTSINAKEHFNDYINLIKSFPLDPSSSTLGRNNLFISVENSTSTAIENQLFNEHLRPIVIPSITKALLSNSTDYNALAAKLATLKTYIEGASIQNEATRTSVNKTIEKHIERIAELNKNYTAIPTLMFIKDDNAFPIISFEKKNKGLLFSILAPWLAGILFTLIVFLFFLKIREIKLT